jgi:type IV secretion system protein VirD4
MRNYAGRRLAPWLGHIMVSREETLRPLLIPGEVLQLPPGDQVVLMSGCPPLRAKKARYVEDRRFTERVLLPRSRAAGGVRRFETILCVRLSPLQPYALVLLIDLIRLVLFLIGPVQIQRGRHRSQPQTKLTSLPR